LSRLVYFDCASGASGDMLLGALVDLGLPLDVLRQELAKLPLGGYRLEARAVDRSGLRATKVDVVIDGRDTHHHDHPPDHPHGHDHRGLGEILDLIGGSALDPAVKDRAAALFRRLAEAEAAVHGTSPEEVHFHEVGAVDSIVDIVGGVCGLAWLGADRAFASPLNVGTGSVTMSHGTFSVPPPATARLLHGVPVYGAGEGELLTPTGALLVTTFATAYGPLPPLRLEGVGHGAGTRDTPGRPNVLRVIVGEEAAGAGQRVMVLETEIDDMPAQIYGFLMDRLFGAGALDVFYTAIQMKKGRPGLLVTALCDPSRREALEEVLFTETTTLGVRRQEWDRTALERDRVTVETPHGPVAIKRGRRGGRVYNAQPEFEDCRRIAEAQGVPVKEVWAAALAAYRGAEERRR
jgi:pyridinium-3,5-bisthiocarboxylic acid mononucleotide nickel chelatase